MNPLKPSSAVQYPTDEHGNALSRAMGLPVVSDVLKIGGTHYVDLIDLSAYGDRVFIGMSIYNPDNTNKIQIAIGENFSTNKVVVCPPAASQTWDDLTFGPGIVDVASAVHGKKLRALLSSASGTLATGTFDYSGGGTPIQPTNGKCVFINGVVYEFSNDASANPGSVYVQIGATADISWQNLAAKISARVAGDGAPGDQAVLATVNTGTHIMTITSEYGGTTGNSIPIADGDAAAANTTGAVVSGATLSGGANGVQPIVTIW